MAKRIAVIGGGVTGVTLAYFMDESKDYEITLFEKGTKLGGQCDTVTVKYNNQFYPIDAIVFLFVPKQYKHFTTWLQLLDIKTTPVDPRHSLWNQATGRSLYTSKKPWDVVKTSFVNIPYLLVLAALLLDVRRSLADGTLHDETPFEDFLKGKWYVTEAFKNDVLYPIMHVNFYTPDRESIAKMPAGISCKMVLDVAENINDTYKLAYGNREYIDVAMKKTNNIHVKLEEKVLIVEKKSEEGPWSVVTDKGSYEFDIIVFATWPHDVLKILKRNRFTSNILDVLAPIPHACVKTTVHSDSRLMPSQHSLWGTYNFSFAPYRKKTQANLWSGQQYDIPVFNDYQWRDTREELESEDDLSIQNVHHVSYHWRTPPSLQLIRAREEIQKLQGTHDLYLGGAYQFNQTFHEDAMTSAFIIIDRLYPESVRLQELRSEADKKYKARLWSLDYVLIEYVFMPLYTLFARWFLLLGAFVSGLIGFHHKEE